MEFFKMTGGMRKERMKLEIRLPEISEVTKEAVLAQWNHSEGEFVREGSVIGEIVTDKASFDLLAPVDGILLKMYKKAGEKITIGELIAEIKEAGNLL